MIILYCTIILKTTSLKLITLLMEATVPVYPKFPHPLLPPVPPVAVAPVSQ